MGKPIPNICSGSPDAKAKRPSKPPSSTSRWGERTCEALRFALANQKRLGEIGIWVDAQVLFDPFAVTLVVFIERIQSWFGVIKATK